LEREGPHRENLWQGMPTRTKASKEKVENGRGQERSLKGEKKSRARVRESRKAFLKENTLKGKGKTTAEKKQGEKKLWGEGKEESLAKTKRS